MDTRQFSLHNGKQLVPVALFCKSGHFYVMAVFVVTVDKAQLNRCLWEEPQNCQE